MTANQFNALCQQYLIDPEIALENDKVRQCLQTRDDRGVKEILENDF